MEKPSQMRRDLAADIDHVYFLDAPWHGYPKAGLDFGIQGGIADTIASISKNARLLIFFKRDRSTHVVVYSVKPLTEHEVETLKHNYIRVTQWADFSEKTFLGNLYYTEFRINTRPWRR